MKDQTGQTYRRYNLERLLKEAEKGNIKRGVISVANIGNQIVVLKRSESRSYFPCWYTASVFGNVEYGESYENAVLRELEEELGLTQSDVKEMKSTGYVYDAVTNFLLRVFDVALHSKAEPRNNCPEEISLVRLCNQRDLLVSAHCLAKFFKLPNIIERSFFQEVFRSRSEFFDFLNAEISKMQWIGLTPSSVCALFLCYCRTASDEKNLVKVDYEKHLSYQKLAHFDMEGVKVVVAECASTGASLLVVYPVPLLELNKLCVCRM